MILNKLNQTSFVLVDYLACQVKKFASNVEEMVKFTLKERFSRNKRKET